MPSRRRRPDRICRSHESATNRTGNEKWHTLEPTFVHIYQYIEELEVPKYPFEIDTQLAAKGKALFEKTCAKCHGTYGPDGKYPNRVVSIEEVGTDPVRLHAVPKENREWNNKGWMQYKGQQPGLVGVEGISRPPLDGIWASAPYFHNGAAPTPVGRDEPDQAAQSLEADRKRLRQDQRRP